MHTTTFLFNYENLHEQIEGIKETDSVKFFGIYLDTKLNSNDLFLKDIQAINFFALCYKKKRLRL